MENVKKLSEIESKPVLRNRTWFDALDDLYGISNNTLGKIQGNYGMPKGKISLWAGESGVGKSRLCIEIAKRFSTIYKDGGIVLYFQTESPLEDFASWAKDTKEYDNIYCSGENRIDEMIKIIYQVKPKLIFVDSVNMIEEFETGNKKESRHLIQGSFDKPGFKQATHDTGAHTILLGQLNQDGKTIKGGTSLPHLVDIALRVVNTTKKGLFCIKVGTKHRYGSRDGQALFEHTDDGVIEYIKTPVSSVQPNSGFRRVPALTKSGFVNERLDGTIDPNDPEFREHIENYKKTKQGREIIRSNKKGLLKTLNEGVGRFFGKD